MLIPMPGQAVVGHQVLGPHGRTDLHLVNQLQRHQSIGLHAFKIPHLAQNEPINIIISRAVL